MRRQVVLIATLFGIVAVMGIVLWQVMREELGCVIDAEGRCAVVSVVAVPGKVALREPAERVAFAAWNDGRVVWSDDRISAGRPLRVARVEPGSVLRLAHELAGTIRAAPRDGGVLVVDGWRTSIVVLDGAGGFALESGHEAHAVAAEAEFAAAWRSVRERIDSFIPATGEPFDGAGLRVERVGVRARR